MQLCLQDHTVVILAHEMGSPSNAARGVAYISAALLDLKYMYIYVYMYNNKYNDELICYILKNCVQGWAEDGLAEEEAAMREGAPLHLLDHVIDYLAGERAQLRAEVKEGAEQQAAEAASAGAILGYLLSDSA